MPVATADDVRGARRILVYGVTGSGKTTVADLLGEAVDLPSHHVDDEIGWLPGWVERPSDDQRRLATEMADAERGSSTARTGSGATSSSPVPRSSSPSTTPVWSA
ncbi:MAG: hypothetical protein ACOH16_12245 [Propionibacteriaceae bacterium]